MPHIHILIVEDQEADFVTVRLNALSVCEGMGMREGATGEASVTIARTRTRLETEEALKQYERDHALLMVVFDVSVPNDQDLDELIEAMATEEHTYRGQRPMIVFTKVNMGDLSRAIVKPRREFVYYIHKFRPRHKGENIRETLRKELQVCIEQLVAEAPNGQ